ncbi:hypothetical protein BCR37DRAFT_383311 [Protomyces lactucae-debilis]|uniref:Uncharacterized protein n=1 Tax=Protomyces lactucae-debilis TaxID=2754530 RepID=A0A1Y2EYK4_PROLT|nr:uncharacterized protein BCR37DRAFT_383311 [Protomyces lactucae-debilis]ORY76668.1 hypothetical protein BCR37DRAFT_383311 [Protomyces lactucae-debilis]
MGHQCSRLAMAPEESSSGPSALVILELDPVSMASAAENSWKDMSIEQAAIRKLTHNIQAVCSDLISCIAGKGSGSSRMLRTPLAGREAA